MHTASLEPCKVMDRASPSPPGSRETWICAPERCEISRIVSPPRPMIAPSRLIGTSTTAISSRPPKRGGPAMISSIKRIACATPSAVPVMVTLRRSDRTVSICTSAAVSRLISVIVAPPVPITAPTSLSGIPITCVVVPTGTRGAFAGRIGLRSF